MSKQTPFTLMAWSAGGFLALVSVAMLVYKGGTYTDASAVGYSFFANFFSDLGRYRLYSGEPNTLCMLIFSITLGSTALVFLPFFTAWRTLFTRRTRARALATIGCGAGIISGIGYLVVSVTPWDLFFPVHLGSVYTGFIGMTLASGFFAGAMFSQDRYPRIAAVIMGLYSLIALSYVCLLFFGPSYKTVVGLRIQVVGQKIIVFTQIAVLLYQALAARRFADRERVV